MLLFRSEEHLDAWRSRRGIATGATLTLDQQWELARSWYADRRAPDWRPRTPEEAEAVFANLGLIGEFWRLASP
jgi:hypothetical protein